MSETVIVGPETYTTVWLRATAKASRKPDLVIVQLNIPTLSEPPTFHVDKALVRGSLGAPGEEVEVEIQVILMDSNTDGSYVVQVPGEAVSYGPRLVIPPELVVD